MTLNDHEPPKQQVLVNFSRHAFQEWTVPKWLEIDQNNLRMKFLALNVDFSRPSPTSFLEMSTSMTLNPKNIGF